MVKVSGHGWQGGRYAHVGGRQHGYGVAAVDQAQGGADQGVEGLLEGPVAHTGAAKGDAPHIGLAPLQRRPCRTCTTPVFDSLVAHMLNPDVHVC